MISILLTALLQTGFPVLENDYVRVTQNGAPCASVETPGCGDRVVVALSTVHLETSGIPRQMVRGDIAVFGENESYAPPADGDYLEVAFKPNPPPVQSPPELIPPEKNTILHDGEQFFVFEERLDPGDTRPRHSHSQRVVIVLNETRLQQWPDGAPEIFKDQVPGTVKFNPPVIHVVKNAGENPLRNIVIELKPAEGRTVSPSTR